MTAAFLPDFWGFADVEINVEYPKHNTPIFERWLLKNYHNYECKTDRNYLPIQWTPYFVNNNYGNDKSALDKLQDYINRLPTDIKYWTCIQYDDSILVDVSRLDLLRFEMSKSTGIGLPLLCQPHPYKFTTEKKWLASFVGSRTHPVRDKLEQFKGKDGYYISFEPHDIETYCRIMHESIFTLCPRGYGLNSFRIAEALQYGSIPVYVSDEFVIPSPINGSSNGHWLLCPPDNINNLDYDLRKWVDKGVGELIENGIKNYKEWYTYDGCMNKIIETLETEFNLRKS